MSDDYFTKEVAKIEVQINDLEQDFTSSMKEAFDKINKDIKANDQKNKFKLKVETEHQLDAISKIFSDIHSLEIKRRELMLKKLKQDQSRVNDRFKNSLKSFREYLFSNERSNLSDNTSIENFLKEILKLEQQLVLAKNEDSYNIIMNDFSLYQLSTKYYQSSNMSKFFIKGLTNNYKFYLSNKNGSEFPLSFYFGNPKSGLDDQDTKTDDGGKYDGDIDPTDTTIPVQSGNDEKIKGDNPTNSDQTLAISLGVTIPIVIISVIILVVVFTKCKKKDLTKEIMLEDESKILED